MIIVWLLTAGAALFLLLTHNDNFHAYMAALLVITFFIAFIHEDDEDPGDYA